MSAISRDQIAPDSLYSRLSSLSSNVQVQVWYLSYCMFFVWTCPLVQCQYARLRRNDGTPSAVLAVVQPGDRRKNPLIVLLLSILTLF